MLSTQRLILRQWKESDFPVFAEMNSCDEVMKYFPAKLSESDSHVLALRLSNLIKTRGWGLWAVELKETSEFIGFTGLHEIPKQLSFSPAIEISWRLSKNYWGKGYATEAANKVLDFAFSKLALEEIVSITSVINLKSRAVMEQVNMINTGRNFFHPLVPDNSPLKEHVLYKITKKQFFSQNKPGIHL